MRTRRSNRTKRFTVEKYDFESSSGEADEPPPNRGQRDADFDGDAAAQDDDDDAAATDSGPDASDASDTAAAEAPPARRAVKAKKSSSAAAAAAPAYRALEPVPSDSHFVKSYVGPYDRVLRGHSLISLWYGPSSQDVRTFQSLLDRWMPWTVLPPKCLPPLGQRRLDSAYWIPGILDREARLAERWRASLRASLAGRPGPSSRALTPEEAAPYRMPARPLTVLLGPYPDQRVVDFQPGDAYCLSQTGIPYEDAADGDAGDAEDEEDDRPIGWMLDAGGIVVGMDWAPSKTQDQRLALAVVPHADHEDYDYETEHQKPDFQRHGVVQLWVFRGDTLDSGIIRPSTQRPRLQKTLCFDYGRARRVKWSPGCGHLAVLCDDGRVCVVEADDGETSEAYEKIEVPLASLSLSDEEGVNATSMAWISFNRLVVGYVDGSVCLWSVHPARLLGRHPLHHSHVVDIATGYPTMPYLVASSPLGGSTKLVDLRSPSCETTEVQVNAVHWQPNLLAWSDHLLGFFSIYPSANALNTMIGFMFHRHFPLVRRIFTGECLLSCLAVGRTHPCLLIGTMDGSLWCLNPQREIFKGRRPGQNRIRLFLHEHRPRELFHPQAPATARGASRVVHGFGVEENSHSMPETKTPAPKKPKRSRKGKKKKGGDGSGDDGEGGDGDGDHAADDVDGGGEEPVALMDPARGILHEYQTRISTVAWNPNEGYGCWAAAAMASGLVRVLDLGLENGAADEDDGDDGDDGD